MTARRRRVASAPASRSIRDVMQDNAHPKSPSKAEATRTSKEPTDVAGVMAQVRADFWKMRAQMLIYHQEKVAALDRLYETLYGEPPSKAPKKRRQRSRPKPGKPR